METIETPRKGMLYKIRRAGQWIVFSFLCLLALVTLIDLRKVYAPNAPLALLYGTIAVTCLLALIHLPRFFERLGRRPQLAAYIAIMPALFLQNSYLEQMEPAWANTPQGAKEIAAQTKAEKERAAADAREAALSKEASRLAAERAAAQKGAELQAQGQSICESLQANIIELSKSGDGPTVIEINRIANDFPGSPGSLSCTGLAITSAGDREIEFGIVTTPQGKRLVTMKLL